MATTSTATAVTFERIPNFRDVGALVSSRSKEIKLKPGLFYRSARPDEATPTDRAHLRSTLKIHTVIDLRSKTEHLEQARKHQQSQNASPPSQSSLTAPSNAAAAHPVKVPGLSYREINFNGTAFSIGLMRQLRYSSATRLVWLMATGYRTAAISILGREVMAERGLVGLAIDSLNYSTSEVLAVFKVLSAGENYPLLVHCTQGKDRTGLTVLLVLMLCGVEREVIREDYLLSQTALRAEREEKLAEIRSIGLPDVFADCPEDWVDKVMDHIEGHYGGVEKYLTKCGVTGEMQGNVKRILLR